MHFNRENICINVYNQVLLQPFQEFRNWNNCNGFLSQFQERKELLEIRWCQNDWWILVGFPAKTTSLPEKYFASNILLPRKFTLFLTLGEPILQYTMEWDWATNDSVELKIWESCWLTLERSHTLVLSASNHSVKLEIWGSICLTLERSCTNVQNAANLTVNPIILGT